MFYYALAEQLGYVSVDQMLGSVSSKELSEWQAYFRVKDEENKKAEKEAAAKRKARRG